MKCGRCQVAKTIKEQGADNVVEVRLGNEYSLILVPSEDGEFVFDGRKWHVHRRLRQLYHDKRICEVVLGRPACEVRVRYGFPKYIVQWEV